jgi:methyltransferase, FkbM family
MRPSAGSDFIVRKETIDPFVYNSVINLNEYGLPQRFLPGDIVLDIGAHIGTFCAAALARGASRVLGIEADEENYRIARRNLIGYIESGELELLLGAALGKQCPGRLGFLGYPTLDNGMINTGGGRIGIRGVGNPIPAFSLDTLIERVSGDYPERIRFLKLDCEGSEWPIILGSESLGRIDEIRGELHEPVDLPADYYGGYEPDALSMGLLEERLLASGFEFSFTPRRPGGPDRDVLGVFRALRRKSGPKGPVP